MQKITITPKQDYLNHRKAADLMMRYAWLDPETEKTTKKHTISLLSNVLQEMSSMINLSEIEWLDGDINSIRKRLAQLLCEETVASQQSGADNYYDTISQALETARNEHKELFELSKKLIRIFHDEVLTITKEQLAHASLEDIEWRFQQTMRTKDDKKEFKEELKTRKELSL
jgi:hypothetical protein